MKRVITIVVFLILILSGCSKSEIKTESGLIVNKYETGNKQFIELQIEVDEMEYIGLDIGDEYIIKK